MTMQEHDSVARTASSAALAAPTPDVPKPEGAPSGRWLGLLALLPILCCGLPLLLATGITAGAGAALGGTAGLVLLVGAVALAVVTLRRRRRAACRTDKSAAATTGRGSCC